MSRPHLAATPGPPEQLRAGYAAFAAGSLRREQDRFAELAEEGQSPRVLVIGCCDSRVSPEVIFDARPGELFVVRNVANLVPPYDPDGDYHGTSAALEYAVQVLKVEHIALLGHASCGGVRAFADGAEALSPGDFVGKWMSLLTPVAAAVGPRDGLSAADYAARLEIASLGAQLAHLRTYPCIRILEERGQLRLHALYFGIASGALSWLDEASGELVPVGPVAASRTPRCDAV